MSPEEAMERIDAIASRMENPGPAIERIAQAGAEAMRRNIQDAGLVGSGELLDSVYATPSAFGAAADHAGYVNDREPFVPVEGGELVEPLASESRQILERYVLEGEV